MNVTRLPTYEPADEGFRGQHRQHIESMCLRGLQPQTVDAYARELRRAWHYFNGRIEQVSVDDWRAYFALLLETAARKSSGF